MKFIKTDCNFWNVKCSDISFKCIKILNRFNIKCLNKKGKTII